MTWRIAIVLLCPLLPACDTAGQDERPADTEAEPAGSSTTDPAASTGEPEDDDAGSSGSTSGGSSSSGPGCTPLPWFPDLDDDGFGPDDAVVMTCDPPPDHVPSGGDCNDADPSVNITVDEVCDAVDNDCDGVVDEPAETNTSCGGCSLFEIESRGYAVCPQPSSWSEAQAHCERGFGGTLVVIDASAENTEVVAFAGAKLPAVWIGLSDLRTEGAFVWADGTPLEFTNWNAGEPNDAAANEDCTQLAAATGYWNDLDCVTPLPYICEVAL